MSSSDKHRYLHHNKHGNALVLVILLFMILSILGLALALVSQSESRMVLHQEKVDQAYYSARAVVEATSQWIQNNYNARDKMKDVVPDRTLAGTVYEKESEFDDTLYTLRIWRDTTNIDRIYIEAEAEFKGVKQTVRQSLDETISGYALFDDAIYSEGPFGKSSGSSNIVNGSVSTGSGSIPANLNVNGTKTVNKQYDFETVNPPDNVTFSAMINSITLGDGDIIQPNAHYHTLNLDGNVRINNTGKVDGKFLDIHIRADNLIMTEKAILDPMDNNGGRIYIYVDEYIFCDKKFGIGGDNAQPIVYIICNGHGDINFSGNPYMNLYLYGPDVNVEYGGTTVFYGAIIANVYAWNGNISVSYRQPDLENSPFSALNQAQKKVSIYNITWTKIN